MVPGAMGFQAIQGKSAIAPPSCGTLIRILRHRPEIVLGMLEIILRCDPVSLQSFSAGQGQVAFIVFLGALSVLRVRVRELGRFISPGGPGSSARYAGHSFRIWTWLCRYRLNFRNVLHVGFHVVCRSGRAVRRSLEELSCCNLVDGPLRAALKSARVRCSWRPISSEGPPNKSISTTF
jgi:hypothetical protein